MLPALLLLGALALVVAPAAQAAPLPPTGPLAPAVCVPLGAGGLALCAQCGYIGFNRGFHVDTNLLCV